MKKKTNDIKKAVVSHLNKDMHEYSEDKKLLGKITKKRRSKPKSKAVKRAKVKIIMEEFRIGKLHSGSEKGPKVTDPKQAIAIAMKESGQSKRKKPSKKRK